MPLWNEIEGQILDGFTLRKLLRSEGRTAWFSTEDAAGAPGVLSVFEALNDEDAVEARLQAAARVAHPNLLAIRKIGRGHLEDESLVYALMEPFDQTLAEVLRDRSLAPDEAREVAGSLLTALESIEAASLYHGHVDASGVLGVGDSIKLRSDCLTTRRTESDAPALAALLYNALTKRRYSSERDALQLPAPFATLVRAGVAPNGSLAAMRRVLNGPAEPPAEVPAPARPATSAPRAASLRTDGEVQPRRRPGITIAALVIMIVVLVSPGMHLSAQPATRQSLEKQQLPRRPNNPLLRFLPKPPQWAMPPPRWAHPKPSGRRQSPHRRRHQPPPP